MYKADSVWEFKISDRIKFGTGAVEELAYEVKKFSCKNVLVITDPGVKKAGILDYIKEILVDFEVVVFDEVEPEPSLNCYKKCIAFAKKNNSDIFIGLGGGSSIDIAKTCSIIAKYGGDVEDYIAPPIGKGKTIEGPGYPMIAVPTTSGTGSEVSPAAVLSLPDKELKVGISSQMQRPNLALVDPLLTISVPPHITAATGIDALCHAIEALTNTKYQNKIQPEDPGTRPIYGGRNIVTNLYAVKAIELAFYNLRNAYNNGQDVEARTNMSLASLLAGIAFTNAGLGAVHALSFPLGGKFHAPHGVAIAALLPSVMKFNAKGDPETFKSIAKLVGENIERLSDDEAALKAVIAVKKLCKDVNIPNISTFGVTEDDLPQMAADAMKIKRLLAGNPCKVKEEDALSIFKDALSG